MTDGSVSGLVGMETSAEGLNLMLHAIIIVIIINMDTLCIKIQNVSKTLQSLTFKP